MRRHNKHDIKDKNLEPDDELLLWEKWIQIRKEEVTSLGERLQESPADLTMNLLYEKRQDKEWKTAIEYAQVEEKPTIRGDLWDQPHRLSSTDTDTVYELKRTAVELAVPDVLEHVCVPKEIQEKELGVIGVPKRKKCIKLNAEFEKYRRKREEALAEKLKKIDPCRPSCSGLFVKGGKPKVPPKKPPPLPLIKESEFIYKDCNLCAVYAIRINNTVIFKDIPGQNLQHLINMKNEKWHEKCIAWNYYFNIPHRRAGRCQLYLQNLGTVALRYCWKKIKRPIPFIPEDIYEQVFFFNKNEDVISPGQEKRILFTFLSEKPGIYSEFWELSFCNIVFFDTFSEKISINLYADCIEKIESIKKKTDILKARIEKKASHNIVRYIMREILDEVFTVRPQIYPYKHLFLEAELFVMKNPVCYYHQTEVGEMKRLYQEMSPTQKWDLSISSWRKEMMAKEYDDRMRNYDLLKKSHADLLKPWLEGEDLASEKRRNVKFLLGQMADKFDKEYARLYNIYAPADEDDGVLLNPSNDTRKKIHPLVRQTISNVFYLSAFEMLCSTIEMCAGIVSSLDLNRWIEFDFCQ